MPELIKQEPTAPDLPPTTGEANVQLPLKAGDIPAATLPNWPATEEDMVQMERILAYVLLTPEGHIEEKLHEKTDKWKWMHGFDYKKLACFAKKQLDETGRIPSTVLYVLLDMFEKGRHRIADVMQMDELPMDREVDDIDWLKSYYLAGMIKDSRGRLNVEAARKKTIRQGRAAIKKVLVALFQRKMTLREDEKGGIQNMAQTVESLEVMKAIHSFAVTDPSIGAYFLNNLSLVKPGKRARKIADQFDFKSIIENVVDAAEDDMDIAIELAKALNNEHTDIAIANVEFSDIKSRIIKHPLAHPNMAIALIRSFDLDSVKNIVLRLARSNGNEEYKELLMEVLAYISSYTHKMTEEVYKYHSILKDTRGQTKGPELYKAQFPKAIKEIETISEMINILMAYDEDNSNLFIGGITEKLNGLRFIFERGNAQYLVKYYESLQVSIIDEDAPLSESTVVVMRHNNGTKEKEKKKKKKKRKRPTGPISVTGNDNGKKCKRPKKGAGKKSQFPKPKAVKKVERERGW